jgi:hypothetical protein
LAAAYGALAVNAAVEIGGNVKSIPVSSLAMRGLGALADMT